MQPWGGDLRVPLEILRAESPGAGNGPAGGGGYARVARGEVLALRECEYITAAVALGASHRRIMMRHLLPNILGPAFVQWLEVPMCLHLDPFTLVLMLRGDACDPALKSR
jgi:hypothetical protein